MTADPANDDSDPPTPPVPTRATPHGLHDPDWLASYRPDGHTRCGQPYWLPPGVSLAAYGPLPIDPTARALGSAA